jgi:hypothetical protein
MEIEAALERPASEQLDPSRPERRENDGLRGRGTSDDELDVSGDATRGSESEGATGDGLRGRGTLRKGSENPGQQELPLDVDAE